DVALGAEIKVQQDEGKSVKHVAVDGQPLGERDGFHYYQFSLNDPWAAEDDTPVRVQVDSNPLISATIVSSTGTTITIATRESLPQEARQKIMLFDDSIELLKRLRE